MVFSSSNFSLIKSKIQKVYKVLLDRVMLNTENESTMAKIKLLPQVVFTLAIKIFVIKVLNYRKCENQTLIVITGNF